MNMTKIRNLALDKNKNFMQVSRKIISPTSSPEKGMYYVRCAPVFSPFKDQQFFAHLAPLFC